MSANVATDRTAAESRKTRVAFLLALRGDANDGVPMTVRDACHKVGISRGTVRGWRETDPEFAAAYDEAMDDGTDLLETEAVRRATKGVPQPVYYQGEECGERQVYSDDLMKFMLMARAPRRFRVGGDVNVLVNNGSGPVDDAQVARALALLLATAQRKQVEGDK